MARNTNARGLLEQVIFISGASSGVGEAAARLSAARGARVALFARRPERLDAIASEIEASGGSALALAGDVRSSGDVERAMGACVERFGRVDGAIACAGVGWPCPLEELTDENWATFIDTNLTGVFNVCRSSALKMKEAGTGAIVTIGSELSLIGMSGYAAYCASKAGVINLTRALAAEMAPTVRVNCLCPGPIDTPMLADEFTYFPDPTQTRLDAIERVPLKRFATAEEVASVALWLLSEEAAYATGAVLSLDGGPTII
jgi:NAD(P)-dependent dehydrogenase (short-subunit alcohol dehydrogenase family)